MAVRTQTEQTVAWAREQNGDPYISIVYDRQQQDTKKPSHPEMEGMSYEAQCLWNIWEQLKFENDILLFKSKPQLPKWLVLPLGLVKQTLSALHEKLGHLGQGKW